MTVVRSHFVVKNLATRGLLLLSTLAAVAMVSASGCGEEGGVGDPCTPEEEYTAAFNDFDVNAPVTQARSYQCRTRLCLVNHFQGRMSCPYGQSADGNAPAGANPCVLPGTKDGKVTGGSSPGRGAEVKPQLSNRRPDQAVYCSCRCANADGRTDDGANYCDCPDGFACKQIMPYYPGRGDQELAGAYCVKNGTEFGLGSRGPECNPTTNPCP